MDVGTARDGSQWHPPPRETSRETAKPRRRRQKPSNRRDTCRCDAPTAPKNRKPIRSSRLRGFARFLSESSRPQIPEPHLRPSAVKTHTSPPPDRGRDAPHANPRPHRTHLIENNRTSRETAKPRRRRQKPSNLRDTFRSDAPAAPKKSRKPISPSRLRGFARFLSDSSRPQIPKPHLRPSAVKTPTGPPPDRG